MLRWTFISAIRANERPATTATARPARRSTPAASAEAAAAELARFEAGPYGERYAAVVHSWRRRWEEVIPFFAFSPEVRKILYTTNAIESLRSQVLKAIRNKGHFPSDEAATCNLRTTATGCSSSAVIALRSNAPPTRGLPSDSTSHRNSASHGAARHAWRTKKPHRHFCRWGWKVSICA